ncbi:hypothetical protein [Devosia sp. A369]
MMNNQKPKLKLVIPKPAAKPKVASPKNNFSVRPGTMAVVSRLASTDGATRLLHGLLELWVEAKKYVEREHDGEMRKFLFLTDKQLQTLTNMSSKQLERAFAALKSSPFVLVASKRLTVDSPNQRAIHLDQAGIWDEVNGILEATVPMLIDKPKSFMDKGPAIKETVYVVNEKVLPYLFRRLYHRVKS